MQFQRNFHFRVFRLNLVVVREFASRIYVCIMFLIETVN